MNKSANEECDVSQHKKLLGVILEGDIKSARIAKNVCQFMCERFKYSKYSPRKSNPSLKS